jgi:septal ring factor EnvC (AmiA/AmiB activator)
MWKRYLLLSLVLLLFSLPLFSDVVLTDEEYRIIMTALDEAEKTLTQQESELISLSEIINEQNKELTDLSNIIEALKRESELQKISFEMLRKEATARKIKYGIGGGLAGFAGGFISGLALR